MAIIELAEDVTGQLKASEISPERVEDARQHMKEGDEIEAKIVNVDRKNRTIHLSIKAKDIAEEQAAVREFSKPTEAGSATLGDLLKEKMND